MTKKQFIERQFSIIGFLRKSPRTYMELEEYLLSKNTDLPQGLSFSKRTLQRDLKEIETIWGVVIAYNKKIGKYEIIEDLDKEYTQRIMEVFDIVSAFSNRDELQNAIFLQRKNENGTIYFKDISMAIKNCFIVKFKLDSYWQEPSYRSCVPIAIKQANDRYYLLGYDLNKKGIRNYGLDRISEFEVIKQKQDPIFFDVKEHYKHALGIETYGQVKQVILEVDISQLKYLQSLPIHSSQKITQIKDYTFLLELQLYITTELCMEILRFGSNIKVIEPSELRENIKQIILELNDLYK